MSGHGPVHPHHPGVLTLCITPSQLWWQLLKLNIVLCQCSQAMCKPDAITIMMTLCHIHTCLHGLFTLNMTICIFLKEHILFSLRGLVVRALIDIECDCDILDCRKAGDVSYPYLVLHPAVFRLQARA